MADDVVRMRDRAEAAEGVGNVRAARVVALQFEVDADRIVVGRVVAGNWPISGDALRLPLQARHDHVQRPSRMIEAGHASGRYMCSVLAMAGARSR